MLLRIKNNNAFMWVWYIAVWNPLSGITINTLDVQYSAQRIIYFSLHQFVRFRSMNICLHRNLISYRFWLVNQNFQNSFESSLLLIFLVHYFRLTKKIFIYNKKKLRFLIAYNKSTFYDTVTPCWKHFRIKIVVLHFINFVRILYACYI